MAKVRWANALACVCALLGAGCSSGGGEPGGPSRSAAPPKELRAICEACTSGEVSTSGASTDACWVGEPTVVDFATAARLGFENFTLLEREFELPLEWIPQPTENGAPASGYETKTTIRGRTTIVGLEHVVPPYPTCTDFLLVTLNLELATSDQALTITGQVQSGFRSTDLSHGIYARLGLNAASGTLELSPDDWSWVRYGNLTVLLNFWPERTRGQLAITLAEALPGGDTAAPGRSYSPLSAEFPKDGCSTIAYPLPPDAPDATPTGLSASQVRDELESRLGTEPLRGNWTTGDAGALTATLGEPSNLCVYSDGFHAQLPLSITSEDGRRIHIDRLAEAWAGYEDGQLRNAWVEVYDDTVIPKADFAEQSGIAGVDFGEVQAAYWYADIFVVDSEGTPPHGEIVVEGVDVDGSQTGIEYAVLGPIASFSWSKP